MNSLKLKNCVFLAFFNPFNTAISNNATGDGTSIQFSYPKTVKKYTIGISKETVSESNFDFGALFSSLFGKIAKKFSGLIGGILGMSSGATTPQPDLEFPGDDDDDFGTSTDDNFNLDLENNEQSLGNEDNDGEIETNDNEDFSIHESNEGYANEYQSHSTKASTRRFSTTAPKVDYLPPDAPTPSYSYELPYIY